MDERTLAWAGGVADAGLCIRLQGGVRQGLALIVFLSCHDEKVLKAWCNAMEIPVDPGRRPGGKLPFGRGTRIRYRDQLRVLETLEPYTVREDLRRAIALRRESRKVKRSGEEVAALVRLWREVRRVETEKT